MNNKLPQLAGLVGSEYQHAYYLANKLRQTERSRRWYLKNKDKHHEQVKSWLSENPEKAIAIRKKCRIKYRDKNKTYSKLYSKTHRHESAARAQSWRKKNPERHKANVVSWRNENRDKLRSYSLLRRSLEYNQIHPLHDFDKELELAHEAIRMTQLTKIVHHVDHVIPLKHGGCHHHFNLQILPQSINQSKNADPFWQMPGYKSWRDVPEFLWPEKLVPAYRAILEKEHPIPQN